MGRRLALLVATYDHEDATLRQLASPAHDAEALAEVLRDPDIAGFEVTTLVNEPYHRVGSAISELYRDRRRDDLTLLYFTGHGLKDDHGRLYLATTDTRHDSLLFTALSAEQIDQAMEGCASRRMVLILDCCYSGAFPARTKGDTEVHALERFQGRGRTVLTASDSTQYSFDGERAQGQAAQSVFTRYLVEGLRDGSADLDGDGDITLDELYGYVHDRVVEAMPQQRPKKQDDVEGRIVIAHNVNWSLPRHLRNALASPMVGDRLGALEGLTHLHRIGNAVVRAAALEEVRRLVDDDSKQVSGAAVMRLASLTPRPAPPSAPSPVPPSAPSPVPSSVPPPTPSPAPASAPEQPASASVPTPDVPRLREPDTAPAPAPEAPRPAQPDTPPAPPRDTPRLREPDVPQAPAPRTHRPTAAEALPVPQAPPGPETPSASEAPRPPAAAPAETPASVPAQFPRTTPVPPRPTAPPSPRSRAAATPSLPRPPRRPALSTRVKVLVAAVVLAVGVAVPVTLAYLGEKGGDKDSAGSFQVAGPTLRASVTDAGSSAVFSPDGTLIAATGDTGVQLLRAADAGTVTTLPHQGYPLFSPAGGLLATVDRDSAAKATVQVRNLATNGTIDILTGAPGSVMMAFSPRGDLLATAAGLAANQDYGNPIRLWNTATGKLVTTLTGFDNGVQSMLFTPDGKTLAAGAAGDPGTVKIWNVTTGKVTATLATGYVIALSPDGRTLATSSEFTADHKASLWDITTGKRLAALSTARPLGFSGDGKLLALMDARNTVELWRISNRAREQLFTGITTARFGPSGERLALVSDTGTVDVVDYTRPLITRTLPAPTSTARIQTADFSPDSTTLTTASQNNTVQVWRLNWSTWVSPSPS
ncbi:caspase, EACC1-associated type [Streptomyces sp. 4F14]|uniref:caspase, EACC1-associated type n=1 Tax=Streptomyces sp. 4F14 TaxID=3394380 RepID=UPI003A86F96A